MEAFPYLSHHSPKDDYSLFNIFSNQTSLHKNSPFLDLPSLDNINSHATTTSSASKSPIPTSNAFRFQQLPIPTTHFPVNLFRFSNHSSRNVNNGPPQPVSDQTKTSAEQGKKRKRLDKTKDREMKRYVCGKRSKVGDKGRSSECSKHSSCEAHKDFIHVRARRGQATDSHSLAERVRREKINERMRILMELVPGCTKPTGKAVILEEIINYVKSLQDQVELLSMKVASLSACYNFSVEIGKEIPMEIKGPKDSSHGRKNSSEAQEASHVFGHSTSYGNVQEKQRTSLEEEIQLESMGANEWDGEMQYWLE